MSLPLFLVTRKSQYAPLSVDHVYVTESLLPPIRLLWNLHRTISQRGNVGRNVAYDLVQEQGNNFIKTGLRDGAKRHDIDPHIEVLNGTHNVQQKVDAALAINKAAPGESDVEAADVAAIVDVLKELLPPSEFCSEKKNNPFGAADVTKGSCESRKGAEGPQSLHREPPRQ